eukprot:scaffold941_cov454-Pavlova_lutheri.AAC.4
MAAGLDSLGAVEVRNSVEGTMGVDLPSTLVFDYPSIHQISLYLLDELCVDQSVVHREDIPSVHHEVGTHPSFFLVASAVHEQRLVVHSWCKERITPVPIARWDVELSHETPRFGGFFADIESFDTILFGITPRESSVMDPQQRLLLQCCLKSLGSIQTRDVSSFVGLSATDYSTLASQLKLKLTPFSLTGSSGSMAAGRISFTFGLDGPAATIDTACSSSMVAAKFALDSLHDLSAQDALTSGASLSIVPESTAMVSMAGMLAADGRCKSMDVSADGYGRGEGCAALLFRRIAIAMDHAGSTLEIAALASVVNQNGRSGSLVAPRGPAQEELVLKALSASGKGASDISGIQLHSNGTLLGDPIEIGAMASVFLAAHHDRNFSFCTVKGFLGHEEAAAGVMLLAHSATVLESRACAPVLHLRFLNSHVSKALKANRYKCNVQFPREAQAFSMENAFRMGVNSFGAQGTNAHVILEGKELNSSGTRIQSIPSPLQKQRCWLTPDFTPLQSICNVSAGLWCFELELCPCKHAVLKDLKILGSPIFSQAGMLALLSEAGKMSMSDNFSALEPALQDVSFVSQLLLDRDLSSTAKLALDGAGTVELSVPGPTVPDGTEQRTCLHGKFLLTGGSFDGSSSNDVKQADACVALLLSKDMPLHYRHQVFDLVPDPRPSSGLRQLECMIGCLVWEVKSHTLRSVGLAKVPLKRNSDTKAWSFFSKAQEQGANAVPLCAGFSCFNGSEFRHPCVATIQDTSIATMGHPDTPVSRIGASEIAGGFQQLLLELKTMNSEDRADWLEQKVSIEVCDMLGRDVDIDEPLMESGIDSRAGMELRQKMSDSLGVDLPVTLLYDYESISQIVDYLNQEIVSSLCDAEERLLTRSTVVFGDVESMPSEEGKPSKLLKTLRGSYPVRPLFLAAPGVANAQSAYFIFKSFLNWSEQPIFVLEKDNDLTVKELAICNATDILDIQPEGPYLIGGHSYGGVVAVQIALQLQEWGHEVGLVILFDTPHPLQCRAVTPDVEEVSDSEANEMMEMVLNAIGEETVGFSTRGNEWLSMEMGQRFEFFAPIWRIMRDNNMTVEEVRDQVYYVAGAVKRGDQVSDLRHHKFTARLYSAPLVCFRAFEKGACTYLDDSDDCSYPHGVAWSEIADTVEVIDVPGDHFTLLRQGNPDMSILVSALRAFLEPFGWVDSGAGEGGSPVFTGNVAPDEQEQEELSAYLAKMGFNLGKETGVTPAMPWACPLEEEPMGDEMQPLVMLNDVPVLADPPLFLVHDFSGNVTRLRLLARALEHPCVGICLGPLEELELLTTLEELAQIYLSRIHNSYPSLPYVMLGGVGFGALLAYEMALQLQAQGKEVATLLLIDDPIHLSMTEACELGHCSFFRLVEGQVSFDEFLKIMKTKRNFEEQLDYLDSIRPPDLSDYEWAEELALCAASAKELDPAWMALYPLVSNKLTIENFVYHMLENESFEGQLDFLSEQKPAKMSVQAWDGIVSQAVRRVTLTERLSNSYKPHWVFQGFTSVLSWLPGQTAGFTGHIPGYIVPGKSSQSLKWISGWQGSRADFNATVSSRSLVETRQFAGLSPDVIESTAECVAQALQCGMSEWKRFHNYTSCRMSPSLVQDETCGRPGVQDEFSYAEAFPEHQVNQKSLKYGVGRQVGIPIHTKRGSLGDMALPADILALNSMCSHVHHKNPIWMLHDEGGGLGNLAQLSNFMSSPCFGVSLSKRCMSADTMEELASFHLDAIRQVQPYGPYVLVGHSFGCALALEMSLQLKQSGEKLALVLVDGSVQRPEAYLINQPHWYALYSVVRQTSGLKLQLDDFVERMSSCKNISEQMRLSATYKPETISVNVWDEAVYSVLAKSQYFEYLALKYCPTTKFSGPSALLCSNDEYGYHFQRTNRIWCTGPMYARYLPCKHTWMLEERNLKGIADIIDLYSQEMLKQVLSELNA